MKNDLISRSALIAHIGDLGIDPEDDTTFLTTGQACAIAHKCIVEMVKEEPTVDAVPVVRCKYCKFYEAGVEYYGGGTKDVCRFLKRQTQEDDFCSYGERRGDDGK